MIQDYSPKKYLIFFFGKNNCKFLPLKKNLIDKIWKRRIDQNKSKFYKLPISSVGNSHKSKINKIVNNLKKNKADFQFISASENSAWLLNIRGRDTKYTPLPNSYILIDKHKKIKFFCNLNKLSLSFKKHLRKLNL